MSTDLINHNKIYLDYYKSGSHGVIFKDKDKKYIYKITSLTNFKYIYENNLLEAIFLNYFTINYDLSTNLNNDYYPIQNIETTILTLEDFLHKYKLSSIGKDKLSISNIIYLDDYVIINKMICYNDNLSSFLHKNITYNKLDIIKKLIVGLNLIHQNNFIHGDLKPSNIVIDNDTVKIIDFGGIKNINNSNYNCTCTITYRPPEDIDYEYTKKNFINYGYKNDIWSIGLIFFEIFNNFNPISNLYDEIRLNNRSYNKSKNELIYITNIKYFLENKEKINFNINNDFDNSLINILEKTLYIDPNKRINSLVELYKELFNEELIPIIKKCNLFNYNLENDKFDKFIFFRKKNYNKIKFKFYVNKYIELLPHTLNLLDRYIISLINLEEDTKLNSKDYKNIIFINCFILSYIAINREISDFLKLINIFDDFLYNVTKDQYYFKVLFENLIHILQVLKFDIIRTELFFYKNYDNNLLNNIILNIFNWNIKEIDGYY